MSIASLLSLAIALYCYAISQLAQQSKLRWGKGYYSFWAGGSWIRKYKNNYNGTGGQSVVNWEKAPNTWYYRFFNIKYKERWPTSATLTVMFTDGYHLFQSLWFTFVSLSIVLAIGFNWWLFLGVLIGTRVIHWSARQILSK